MGTTNETNIKTNIPLWRKYTLTVQEAAKYFRIGDKKLKRLIDENPTAEYILWNGNRPQIKRKLFEQFLDEYLSSVYPTINKEKYIKQLIEYGENVESEPSL